MSYIGSNKIGGMYLGSTEIAKAYLGSDVVYQKASSTPVEPRSVDATIDAYMATNGAVQNGNSGFFYTSTVAVTSGQTVTFVGKSGAACSAIYYYDSGGTFHNAKAGAGSSTTKTYTWTADQDCEVGVCGKVTVDSFSVGSETITINYPS